MTVEINTLRVVSEMDSSSYEAGARQKAAADDVMVASAQKAGQAFTQLDQKISNSANATERLKRTYVDGYASAQRFNQAIDNLSRSIERGNISLEDASGVLDGIYRKHNMVADSSRFAAKGQLEFATAVDQLNAKLIAQQNIKPANQNLNLSGRINQSLNVQSDFGGASRSADIAAYASEMDKLQAKFDPLFAASQRYVGALNEINNAERVGAISASIATQQRLKEADAYRVLKNEILQANQSMSLAGRVNQSLNVRSDFGGASRSEDIAAYGSELDKLRAKYNPMFGVIREYKTELEDIRKAQKVGAIGADEMAAATSRLRQSTLGSIAALKGQKQGMSDGRQSFAATNIAYQAQDVITQAAMGGASPAMIALQQGPQAAMSFQGMSARQAISAIGGAAASIVSPISLATIAITGLLAAGIGYFSRISFGAKSADEVLKEHQLAIQKIKETYDAASKSRDQFGQRAQTELRYLSNTDQTQLQKSLEQSLKASSLKLTPAIDLSQYDYAGADIAGTQEQQFKDKYGAYSQAVFEFSQSAKVGAGDVAAFREEIQRIANIDPSNRVLQENAKSILDITNNASEAAKALEELTQKQREYEITFSRTQAAANMQKYNSENGEKMRDMQRQQNATLIGIGARSPQQLERAARAREEAKAVDPTESPQTRQFRIDSAGMIARRQAEQQLTQSQNERVRSLNASVDAQKNELSLIGKTGGELASLQMQYQLIASLRENAARTGAKVDEEEIAYIKQRADEAGRYVDQINKAKFQDDLSFQQRQLGRNAGDQQIATQLRGAGLPEDLKSGEANQLRSMAQQQAAKAQLNSFYSDFVSSLRNNGGDAGKAFGDAFKNTLLNSATKMGEQAMDKIFGWLVSGLQSQGGSQAGGVGGLVSKGLGFTGGVASQSFGGAANDNRSMTGSMSQYAAATKDIESSGNYSALGPVTKNGDRAYGAYQVMGSNIPSWTKQAVGQSMTAEEFLKNPSAQDAVFNQQFGKSVSKYGNPQDAASVWFTGRPQAQGANAKDILGTSGTQYVDKFNSSLSKGSVEMDSVTKSMGGFGSGISQVGKSLTGKSGGVANVAGGFDWSSLTSPSFKTNTTLSDILGAPGGKTPAGFSGSQGGDSGIFSLFGSLAKSFGGLFHFADGTESAPGGVAMVGERGRELVNLPRGSQVVPNHRTESLIAANKNGSAGFSGRQASPQVHVTIMGNTYSDGHLQSSINSAVQQGLQTQQINNRRGGTGIEYDRWNKDKG
ncbi:phage tail length tape measure family protein [Rhizobium sp.]|jgi:hypothetical protein|uniref:phage tail length tape measure family protein n=1 Tax=Rhizobium sp. TaxID=391 RepID=UPI000E9F49F1|nr:hypothetical protein [Rhizobium sp.]